MYWKKNSGEEKKKVSENGHIVFVQENFVATDGHFDATTTLVQTIAIPASVKRKKKYIIFLISAVIIIIIIMITAVDS